MDSKNRRITPSKEGRRNLRRISTRIALRTAPFKSAIVKRVTTIRKRTSTFDLNGAFADISSSLTSSLSKPTVLLAALAVLAVVVTNDTVFTATGFIGKWTTANPENPLAIWIVANKAKFMGLLIAAPTIFAAPKSLQVMLAIASFFWVMIVPESTVYQYVFQSLAMHTYFRVKHPDSRMLIIVITAVSYYLGWIVLTPASTPPAEG